MEVVNYRATGAVNEALRWIIRRKLSGRHCRDGDNRNEELHAVGIRAKVFLWAIKIKCRQCCLLRADSTFG